LNPSVWGGAEFRASLQRKRNNRRQVIRVSRSMVLPGVDRGLKKILNANMDEVGARRRAREAFKDIQLGIDHILFKVWFCFVSFVLVLFVELSNSKPFFLFPICLVFVL